MTMGAGIRVCAAVCLAVAVAGVGVRAESKAVAGTPQVGTMQIASLGGAVSPIFGFGFSVTNPSSGSVGSGSGSGKAVLSAVEVTRIPDGTSPELFRRAVLGTHIPVVQILTNGSGKTTDAAYTLNNVTVSGFENADGVERVLFTYRSIEIVSGGSSFCFDAAENASC